MQRRSTKQRDIVAAALRDLYHPTADEVYEQIQKTHPGVGRATVFRNLTVLAEEGRVKRLDFPGDAARYDPINNGHAHFVCKKCGKIIDLALIKEVEFPKSREFVIQDCVVTYEGVCRNCCDSSNKNII